MNSICKAVLSRLAAPLITCFLAGLVYAGGYGHGRAKGEAALREVKMQRAEEKQRQTENFAQALAETLAAHEAETARVSKLSGQLQQERQRHESETRALERRIAAVTSGSAHVFSTDFICMFNAAAGVRDSSAPGASAAFVSDPGAAPCASFGPGLLELFAGVGEAELLAWFVEYAGRCRIMEDQLAGWRNFAGERGDK